MLDKKASSRSRRPLFPTIVGKIAFNIYEVNISLQKLLQTEPQASFPYNRRENTIVFSIAFNINEEPRLDKKLFTNK
jgi:hypothetical protein